MSKSPALLTLLLLPLMAMAQPASTVDEFNELIVSYATAEEDIVVEVSANLTLTSLVSIPTPGTAGITLTMRSENSATPVILTRGINGDLFTVSAGATFILEDIIIDGDKDGDFADGGGSLARVNGGTLFIENGSVLRNNDHSNNYNHGGGVSVYGSGALIMNGGEISGNVNISYNYNYSHGSLFSMNGGEISGDVNVYGVLFHNGGEVSGDVNVFDYGVLFHNGGEVSGDVNVRSYGVIIKWSKPATGPFVYTEGTSNGLSVKYDEDYCKAATAFWAIEDGKFGIAYKSGYYEEDVDDEHYEGYAIEGFIEIPEVTVIEDPAPIRRPQIANSQISVKAASGAIMLENLPANSRVEVYNLEGKRLHSNNPENLKILKIMVQTKGVYIVKINNAAFRVAVK